MKNKLGLAAIILIGFLLQCSVLDRIAIGQIKPNLLVILCASMGLIRGRKSGLWTGFWCGLLVDLFYGSLFGFYALVYMYAGFFCGYAHRLFYDNDIRVPVVLSAAADLLLNLAFYGLQFLLRGRLGLHTYLVRIILPEMFYTTILALVIYRPVRALVYQLQRASWKESESIWVLK